MSEPDPSPAHHPGKKRDGQSWESWIDEVIRDAQARGEFDNLAGAGKPLANRRNPFLPEDQQLAYDLIQNSGHTLPWIDDAREIGQRIEAGRGRLARQHAWWLAQREKASGDDQRLVEVDLVWERCRTRFVEEAAAINRLIDVNNLKAPHPRLHKLRLVVAEEFER